MGALSQPVSFGERFGVPHAVFVDVNTGDSTPSSPPGTQRGRRTAAYLENIATIGDTELIGKPEPLRDVSQLLWPSPP
jgi:hypothetical protein